MLSQHRVEGARIFQAVGMAKGGVEDKHQVLEMVREAWAANLPQGLRGKDLKGGQPPRRALLLAPAWLPGCSMWPSGVTWGQRRGSVSTPTPSVDMQKVLFPFPLTCQISKYDQPTCPSNQITLCLAK